MKAKKTKPLKPKPLFNNVEMAIIYYKLLGKEYEFETSKGRNLARNNFRATKKAKKLKREILEKAFEQYFQKIREDFE